MGQWVDGVLALWPCARGMCCRTSSSGQRRTAAGEQGKDWTAQTGKEIRLIKGELKRRQARGKLKGNNTAIIYPLSPVRFDLYITGVNVPKDSLHTVVGIETVRSSNWWKKYFSAETDWIEIIRNYDWWKKLF